GPVCAGTKAIGGIAGAAPARRIGPAAYEPAGYGESGPGVAGKVLHARRRRQAARRIARRCAHHAQCARPASAAVESHACLPLRPRTSELGMGFAQAEALVIVGEDAR